MVLFSLCRFTLVINYVFFRTLLGFDFLLGMTESSLRSIFPISVNLLLPLVALQLLRLFVGSLTYLEPKQLPLIIFYSGTFLLTRILIVVNVNIYVFSPYSKMIGVTAYIEFLMFYKLHDLPCFHFCLGACVDFLSYIARIFFVIGLWALE
jgi:hypothetical protein